MISLVSVLGVIDAFVKEIRKQIPEAKNYVGNLPEKKKAPCFLHLLTFHKDTQNNLYTKNCILNLQILFFTDLNYGKPDLTKQLAVMESLKLFLGKFHIEVDGRDLKFDYDFSIVDEQLSLNIRLKYMESVVKAAEEYEKMLKIYMNKELI